MDQVDMGLLDFIQTADPQKVRAVEAQKGADQVTLLESTKDCFMPLVIPAAGGSSSAAAAKVSVPAEERQESVAPEDAYLNLADPDEDAIAVRQGEERVVSEQLKKIMPEGSHLLAQEQPVALIPLDDKLTREELMGPLLAYPCDKIELEEAL
ncbi:hypothetical protein Tco_1345812 [Tanacetum coccineum]